MTLNIVRMLKALYRQKTGTGKQLQLCCFGPIRKYSLKTIARRMPWNNICHQCLLQLFIHYWPESDSSCAINWVHIHNILHMPFHVCDISRSMRWASKCTQPTHVHLYDSTKRRMSVVVVHSCVCKHMCHSLLLAEWQLKITLIELQS